MELIKEGLDPNLNLVQVLHDTELPEHDELYQQTKEAIDDQQEAQADADVPDAGDPDGEPDEADSSEADGALTDIDNRQTTEATESIRNDTSYVYVAEAFLEEGSFARNAAVGVSKFAWNILSETAGYLKDLGVTYGPGILSRLKSTVALVAGRSLRLGIKLFTSSVEAYQHKKSQFEKTQKRILKLKATLALLKDQDTVLTVKEPFENQAYADLFLVNGKTGSIKESAVVVAKLLNSLKENIDKGMEHDVRVVEQLIDNTVRGIRFNPMVYLKAPKLTGSFTKRDIQGFSPHSELIDTLLYGDLLPNDILMIFGLPKDSVVDEAIKTNDITQVTKAYHGSFIVLAANPAKTKSTSLVNYVDKDTLLYLLENAEGICAAALQHVDFYRQNVKRAERLKTGYRHYFAWLTENEEQKSLRDSLAELIYLKQTFVTKVYLPAMLDTHDYVAMYLNTLLSFVEANLRVIKLKTDDQDSAA